MTDEPFAELICRAQSGDPTAFDRLVDLFAGRLFGFLFRMTGSRHDAEDLMQEVFLRVVRTIGAYQHDGRFEGWIFRIATNLVRDRIRRAGRGPKEVAIPMTVAEDDGQSPAMAAPDSGARRSRIASDERQNLTARAVDEERSLAAEAADKDRCPSSGEEPRLGASPNAEAEAADAPLLRAEEVDAMHAALAELSDAEREVIMLRHFSQLSFRKIAELTGMPLGTALARAHRGLTHLRDLLGAPAGERTKMVQR